MGVHRIRKIAATLTIAAVAGSCGGDDTGGGAPDDEDASSVSEDSAQCAGLLTADDVGDVLGATVTFEEFSDADAAQRFLEDDVRGEELVGQDQAELHVCEFSDADSVRATVYVVRPGDSGWPEERVADYVADYGSQTTTIGGAEAVFLSDEIPPDRGDLWVNVGNDFDLVVVGDGLTPADTEAIAEIAVAAADSGSEPAAGSGA